MISLKFKRQYSQNRGQKEIMYKKIKRGNKIKIRTLKLNSLGINNFKNINEENINVKDIKKRKKRLINYKILKGK